MMIRFYRGERIGATKLNQLVDAVDRATPYGDVMRTPNGTVVQSHRRFGQGSAEDVEVYDPWWYTLNPDGDNVAEVEIGAGEWTHGIRAIIDVAAAKIVLTADHQYVWTSYVMGSGVAYIAGPSTTRPVSSEEDSTVRFWLWQFRLIEGVASPERRGYQGNIIIPGTFA